MRDVVVKRVGLDGECGGTSKYLVKVNHEEHKIYFAFIGGCDPLNSSVIQYLCTDRDIVKEIEWVLTQYRRKYPITTAVRTGMSGCVDMRLFAHEHGTDWAQPYVSKLVCDWHISSMNKFNQGIPDMFSGDLVDMLRLYFNYYGWDINSAEEFRECVKVQKRLSPKYVYTKLWKPHNDFVQSLCGSAAMDE